MSKGQINLQDTFLNLVRKDKTPVTVYLVNGFQIKGVVKGFDNFTVVVEMDNKQQLIYKHAIFYRGSNPPDGSHAQSRF